MIGVGTLNKPKEIKENIMNKILPLEISNEIYDILVEDLHAPARDIDREQFVQAFSSPSSWGEYHQACKEYRFGGTYALAGKFWWNNDRFYCSGWSRSEIDAKHYQMQEKNLQVVNARLAKVYVRYLDQILHLSS